MGECGKQEPPQGNLTAGRRSCSEFSPSRSFPESRGVFEAFADAEPKGGEKIIGNQARNGGIVAENGKRVRISCVFASSFRTKQR